MKRRLLSLVALVLLLPGCEQPNTNDWSSAHREEFLLSCTDHGEPDVCLCTLEALEEAYSDPEDFLEEDFDRQTDDYADALEFCDEQLNG